ncbi:MAG: glycosyltransferase [Candidatus Cloacimonetes bacterium]|nr:glycosyltransferase [Candidatus Cloacimonadota bacterium]
MKKTLRVLIVSSYSVAFVLRDIELLQQHFNVEVANFVGIKKTIRETLKTIIVIWKKLQSCDLSFIWFADFRAMITIMFSKLLKKKTILVVGGYEVANEPQISYGGAFSPKLKSKISWIIRHADVVLSVSEASKNELIQNYGYTQSILVYNGVETEKFLVDSVIPKENIAITVGAVTSSNLSRKGIETFVKAAAYLPGIPFYVIGKADEATLQYLKKIATENVIFTGYVIEEELIRFYQKARVYVQVSGHEGFGISLAEGMLCECIPVVTKKGALPELVGDNGYYVPFNAPEETAKAIQKALQSTKGTHVRNHILEHFSMQRRENALVNLIKHTAWK